MRRCTCCLLSAVLLTACGGGSPDDVFVSARAALERGDFAAAVSVSTEAASSGDVRYEALRAFVRGNIAYTHSMAMEAEVNQPNADARARARALAFAEDALALWRAAVVTRADWPEARRNIERALLRVKHLREHRKDRKPQKKPPKEPPPSIAKVNETDLSPAALLTLRELLRKKEDAKRTLRRAERKRASSRVERDW